jgi:hypothetical protein
MNTLVHDLRAINLVKNSLGIPSTCSHPVLEKKPDDFMYCAICDAYVETMDE